MAEWFLFLIELFSFEYNNKDKLILTHQIFEK
jgi:hypothetical protein